MENKVEGSGGKFISQQDFHGTLGKDISTTINEIGGILRV